MRVLFVVSTLGFGGAESQIILLSNELVRLGHEVSIYSLTRETPRVDELSPRVGVLVDRKRWRLDPGVLARLRRHIRAWRPDLVHGFLYDGDVYSRLAAAGTGVPVLNSERSDNYRLTLVQQLGYRLTSSLCDGIVANSHSGARFAQRLHRVPRTRVAVVWNGIDLRAIDQRLERSARPAERIFPGAHLKRLVMVASFRPGKDHPLALRVLRRLVDRDPAWRLICVGEELSRHPGCKAAAFSECERLGLEPYVKFVGHRRDVPEIVASSDVLLVTSVNEGFPNVVLEAMACGTPAVSTDYSDVRRILPWAEQVAGERDPGTLADAVLHCYGRRAELARAQRRWVERHATASASVAALLAAYAGFNAPASGATRGNHGKGHLRV